MKPVNFKLVMHHVGTVVGYIVALMLLIAVVLAAIKLVLISLRWLLG